MVLIMSLELVAVSAAAHLTGVVIYVVCFGYGYEEGVGDSWDKKGIDITPDPFGGGAYNL